MTTDCTTSKRTQLPEQKKEGTHRVFNNKYHVLQELGEGMTAKVFLGREIESKKLVAIKFLMKSHLSKSSSRVADFRREIDILSKLEHQGIVNMIEAGEDGILQGTNQTTKQNISYIVMDYYPDEFFNFCVNMGAMGEDAGKFFLSQLLDTLEYVHNKNICHRDLKIDNMLIDEDLNIKLLDFGLSCQTKTRGLKDSVGTPFYMAPELHEERAHSGTEVDVFALGVILFTIIAGNFPFDRAVKSNCFFNLLMTDQLDLFFSSHKVTHLSANFKDLIVRMLAYDSKRRPTIDDIRNHPWMKEKGFQINLESKLRLKKSLILPSSRSKAIATKLGKPKRVTQHVITPAMVPISKSSLDLTRKLLKEAYYYKSPKNAQESTTSESAKSTLTTNSSESHMSRSK